MLVQFAFLFVLPITVYSCTGLEGETVELVLPKKTKGGTKTLEIRIVGAPPVKWTYYDGADKIYAYKEQVNSSSFVSLLIETELKGALISAFLKWGINPNYHPITVSTYTEMVPHCNKNTGSGIGQSIGGPSSNGFIKSKMVVTTMIDPAKCQIDDYDEAVKLPLNFTNTIKASAMAITKNDVEAVCKRFKTLMIEIKRSQESTIITCMAK
uniref:Peptidase S1 domain-containing protein n=1 Tax=Rhabditophanes sp. KR3021 TaxID=114890 RepID=A0AC35UH92_9BILA